MAREFRQLHSERHVIVVQLEDLLTLMQRRDQDIRDQAEVCTYLRWVTWVAAHVVVSGVGLINEVNRHWARLVLGWVAACGRVNHLGM